MNIKTLYMLMGKQQDSSFTQNDRFDFINLVYKKLYIPKLNSVKKITLSPEDILIIDKFVKKKVKAKSKEWGDTDSFNRIEREKTGAIFEYAVFKFYDKEEYFDDSIVSKSYLKNDPDLIKNGVIADLKGCHFNSVPLVFKSSRSYECKIDKFIGKRYKCCNIIGVVNPKTYSVYVLGIATPLVLQTYVDDNLIGNCENPTKTGFYGVNYLIDLPKSWDELKSICSKNMMIG